MKVEDYNKAEVLANEVRLLKKFKRALERAKESPGNTAFNLNIRPTGDSLTSYGDHSGIPKDGLTEAEKFNAEINEAIEDCASKLLRITNRYIKNIEKEFEKI